MTPLPEIIQGHALDVLRTLEDNRFQCCVTSPPYFGLRNYYGEPPIWGGESNCKHEWESYLVRKTGGGKAWLGETQLAAQSVAHYVSQCTECGAIRCSLGEEPTPDLYIEHLMMILDEVRRVLRDDGVLWLVVAGSYSRANSKLSALKDEIPPKSQYLIPERIGLAMLERGWIIRNKVVWYKTNALPAPTSDRLRCCWEYVYFCAKQRRYKFRLERIKQPTKAPNRWPPIGKGTRAARMQNDSDSMKSQPLVNPGDVWDIPTQPRKEEFFAAFPDKLAKRCILASTDEGDWVLDPFAGRGTTCIQAYLLDRPSLGIELNNEYAELARSNIAQAAQHRQLELLRL